MLRELISTSTRFVRSCPNATGFFAFGNGTQHLLYEYLSANLRGRQG
jgi:hypothetical protein